MSKRHFIINVSKRFMDEFLNWFVIIKIRFPAHSSLQIQENRQKLNRCATLANIFHDSKTRGWWSSWTTSFLKQFGNKIKICLCDKNWPFLNVIQSKFKYILANAFKISSSLRAPNRPTAVYVCMVCMNVSEDTFSMLVFWIKLISCIISIRKM